MAKPHMQITSKNLHAVAGALLFSFGLTLLAANLNKVAVQVSGWFGATPRSLGAAIEIGLASLRAVQAYFFDQSAFQAGFLSILVSLWPLILVIIGAILLHDATGIRFANTKMARTLSSGEYESES
jgi:ascorbate-specific PTS system EIIC-type component UlaA